MLFIDELSDSGYKILILLSLLIYILSGIRQTSNQPSNKQ